MPEDSVEHFEDELASALRELGDSTATEGMLSDGTRYGACMLAQIVSCSSSIFGVVHHK